MVKSEIELSVVVPAYNEAERIPKTLRRLHEYLGANSFAYEILVVLDGPIDVLARCCGKCFLESHISRSSIVP